MENIKTKISNFKKYLEISPFSEEINNNQKQLDDYLKVENIKFIKSFFTNTSSLVDFAMCELLTQEKDLSSKYEQKDLDKLKEEMTNLLS